jgi:hypothetical protein
MPVTQRYVRLVHLDRYVQDCSGHQFLAIEIAASATRRPGGQPAVSGRTEAKRPQKGAQAHAMVQLARRCHRVGIERPAHKLGVASANPQHLIERGIEKANLTCECPPIGSRNQCFDMDFQHLSGSRTLDGKWTKQTRTFVYYQRHAKSDRIDARVLARLPLVNPDKLHRLMLPSATAFAC